jgi:hypothetical protein
MMLQLNYQVKISNRFAVSNDVVVNVDVSRAWEAIRKNAKSSVTESLDYCDLKEHKSWFYEECS